MFGWKGRRWRALWSRRGNSLTSQLPVIAKACELLPVGTLVDGEIVAMDAEGQPSFNTLQGHRSQASDIRLFVFDLLILGGQYMLRDALRQRRAALDDIVLALQKKATAVELSQSVFAPAQDMID